jgi:hypothetical protein
MGSPHGEEQPGKAGMRLEPRMAPVRRALRRNVAVEDETGAGHEVER